MEGRRVRRRWVEGAGLGDGLARGGRGRREEW